MDYGPYSIFKPAHISHQGRMLSLSQGLCAAPAQVHLVITNRCNHNCSFCAYRSSRSSSSQNFDKTDQIDWDSRGRKLIEELARAGTSAIQFTGGGEPTVHPRFTDFLSVTFSHGMKAALVTNGGNVGDVDMHLVMRLSWIRFSLDAATAETHARLHGVSVKEFSRVTENIHRVVKEKGRAGHGPVIGVGFVISPENWRETGQAIEMADALGVDNIRISAAFFADAIGSHLEYFEEVKEMILQAKKKARFGLRVFDLFGDRVEDLVQRNPRQPRCWISKLVPYIAADLNIYTCCVLAYNRRGLLGSVAEAPFDTFWRDEAHPVLSRFDASGCPLCMFNEKNRMLEYMMNLGSQHVDFL